MFDRGSRNIAKPISRRIQLGCQKYFAETAKFAFEAAHLFIGVAPYRGAADRDLAPITLARPSGKPLIVPTLFQPGHAIAASVAQGANAGAIDLPLALLQ